MGNKVEDLSDLRANRWDKYREYLEGLDEHLTANTVLAPGTKAFEKLKALSDRLAEVQEKDFTARQLKQEIDRALSAAAGGGGGGLLRAFSAGKRHKDDDDRFG